MEILKKIVYGIDIFNEKICRIFSYLTFFLIFSLTYEVISRYVFNNPTQWSFDATYFSCSLFLALGMAHTWRAGEHVNVDFIIVKFPKRVAAGINAFFMIVLFFLTWVGIVRVLYPHVLNSWALKERSMTGFMPPIYPYKTWILVGIIFLLLQGVSEFIRYIHVMITGDESL